MGVVVGEPLIHLYHSWCFPITLFIHSNYTSELFGDDDDDDEQEGSGSGQYGNKSHDKENANIAFNTNNYNKL